MTSRRRTIGLIALSIAICIGSIAVEAGAQKWVEQGPGPILNGQDEGIANNPVSGGVCAIAVDPSDPTGNTVYVGTVNGGVWKTTNFETAAVDGTVWSPLTDFAFPGLSVNALAISPVNPQFIYAGTGSTSSYASDGNPCLGIEVSTDGGVTWTPKASATFAGRNITSVVPTKLNNGAVILASTLFDGGGVYRSQDGGTTFSRISGGSGLPNGGVSNLVSDPGNDNRFYCAVPGFFGAPAGTEGVYRSDDGGLTWVPASTGITGLSTAIRILLSVHNSTAGNAVYAAVINTSGQLSGVFRSANQGATWTTMGAPSPGIFPGQQGIIHGAIAADPSDPSVVFISGDRQDQPFPNINGSSNYTGSVFRGVFSALNGSSWQNLVMNGNGGGANGTSPHADSRAIVFDPAQNLIQGNDGGVFMLKTPNVPATRIWISRNGNIRPTETHSVAYDPLAKVLFSGNQDTGASVQAVLGSFQWVEVVQGDGGVVAIDADQAAHPGSSIRYLSYTGLAHYRTFWSPANAFLTLQYINYQIVAGPGSGLSIDLFDPNIQFYNPYVLNNIDKNRMLIGTSNLYESKDRGDTVANLGFTGASIGDGFGNSPLAYGGRLSGVANPGVFYAGSGNTIRHRSMDGAPIVTLTHYPGGIVRSIVLDPQNWKHVFVADTANHVFGSFDEGATWQNLTLNLPTLCPSVRTLQIFSPSSSPVNTVLIAGGQGGVFQMRRPGAAGTTWTALSSGMPHALVYDLQYDYPDNVLVAGTLGRGCWTLTNYFRGGGGAGVQSVAPPKALPDISKMVIPGIQAQPPVAKPMRP